MSLGEKSETYQTALHTFGFWDEKQEIKLDVAVWYPGQTQTQIIEHHGWMVQACTNKRSIAKVIPGFYPVILLSHDTASSYFANNDIAAALAAQGFFVIVPAHTGDTVSNGNAIYEAHLLRDRPFHLLRALDLVLSKPEFAPFVDESRIGLIGVGAGAATVSQLTGLKPQAELLASYCSENRLYDITCAGWSEDLLQKFTGDFNRLLQEHGETAFTPPLDTFAPKFLEEIPIPVETEVARIPEKEEEQDISFSAKISNIFKKDKPAAKSDTPPPPAPETPPQFVADFQGGLLYGGTIAGNTFTMFLPAADTVWIHPITMPDREAEPDFASEAKKIDNRPFRRPANIRSIKAVAFLAPAGGFLFDSGKPNKQLPALSVFPEKSSLYPYTYHAGPYVQLFPSYHEVEVIDDADHYALFATCTQKLQTILPETCGNLQDEDKEAADDKKITAITLFFEQYLGNPLPPQPPTGLKAAHE